MTDNAAYIIDCAKWQLDRLEQGDQPDDVYFNFTLLLSFLRENSLLRREFNGEVKEDFELLSSDLTDEGLMVLKNGYDSWLASFDSVARASDVRPLERALLKVRGKRKVR